jgi:hypothetical protein
MAPRQGGTGEGNEAAPKARIPFGGRPGVLTIFVVLMAASISCSYWQGTLVRSPDDVALQQAPESVRVTAVVEERTVTSSLSIQGTVIPASTVDVRVDAAESSGRLVLLVRTETGYPAALRAAIPLALDAAQPGTYTVSLTADLRLLRRGVSADLADLVRVVSWALLLFSGLGAASAMYLAVQSRSAEIALRRALGASRPSIARIFLLEGAILGLGGGLLGSALGTAAVVIHCLAQQWTAVLSPMLVWWGTGIGAVVGVAASTYPAWTAATGSIAERIRG